LAVARKKKCIEEDMIERDMEKFAVSTVVVGRPEKSL
jgi:hypothetical protein